MSDQPSANDKNNALGKTYELLLKKAIEEIRQAEDKSGPALHHLIDKISSELNGVEYLSDTELQQLTSGLKRDLVDAADHIAGPGKDFKSWLSFDMELIEDTLLGLFMDAADKTTVELAELKAEAMAAGYQTGEVIGFGTLICDECGETLHFHKPGHIPPCPKCKATHFHRTLEA
jgi:hypothetical protein